MPCHIADDEQCAAVREFDRAVPVAAEVEAFLEGPVGDVDIEAGQVQHLLRQRQQAVLETGGEVAFGGQETVLDERALAVVQQLLLGILGSGQVLKETVDLDRMTVHVRLGFGDDPNVPDPAVVGTDAEGMVDGRTVAQETLHGRAERGQVLGGDVGGHFLQRHRAPGRVPVEDRIDLLGPRDHVADQIPVGPPHSRQALHGPEPALLTFAGVQPGPGHDQAALAGCGPYAVAGQARDAGRDLLVLQLSLVRVPACQRLQVAVPQLGVGGRGIRLKDAEPHQFAAAASADVDRVGRGGGESQVHHLAFGPQHRLEEDH